MKLLQNKIAISKFKLNIKSNKISEITKEKIIHEINKSFGNSRNSSKFYANKSYENPRSFMKPRYAYNDSKLKSAKRENQSYEYSQIKDESSEYGYSLPIITNSKHPTFRNTK